MEKTDDSQKAFHDQTNQRYADKYKTTPRIVGAVRGTAIQENLSLIEFQDFAEEKVAKINSSIDRHERSVAYHHRRIEKFPERKTEIALIIEKIHQFKHNAIQRRDFWLSVYTFVHPLGDAQWKDLTER